MSRSAGRTRAALNMVVPSARVAVRRVRRGRPARAAAEAATVEVDGRTVVVPDGPGPVRVDDEVVGDADVRRDPGTSTVEAWMHVTVEAVPLVVRAVEAQADGARRVAWLVEPGTPEAAAVEAAGYERESAWAAPLVRTGVPHELWSRITTPPAAR